MTWIPVEKRLPKKSGEYLVACQHTENFPSGEKTFYTYGTVYYSAQYKAFNAFDGQDPPKHAFDDVAYWSKFSKIEDAAV